MNIQLPGPGTYVLTVTERADPDTRRALAQILHLQRLTLTDEQRSLLAMTQLDTDISRLQGDVTAEGAAIAQIAPLVQSQTQSITDLRAQVDALKAQIAAGQAPDLSGLEAALGTFETQNSQLAAIAPPPTTTPTDGTGGSTGTGGSPDGGGATTTTGDGSGTPPAPPV